MKNILIILLLLYYSITGNATNYYFSNTGSDVGAGTISAPWQTLTKFNSVFASRQPGDSLLFKRGDTFFGTMKISRSGTSTLPIIIGAYGTGAKPIITGFTTVTAWTDLGSGIHQSTSAVTTLTTLKMVTFQDTLQPMGRWPKVTASNGGYLVHQTHSGTTSITSNQISGALSYVGGEVVIRKYPWQIDRATITAQTSTRITSTPHNNPDDPGHHYQPIDGHGFFFQNHVNACTVLGEWAFDGATKKIKMYFGGSSPGSYTINVSTRDTLVDVSSRSYVRFDNLKFVGSNFKTFNSSLTNNVQLNSCDIDFAGAHGIWAHSSTNNIKVYNCTFSHCNNNAITGNNGTSWVIQNNTFSDNGMVRGAGFSGDGHYNAMTYIGSKSLVEYNVIKRTGLLGIQFTGDSVVVKNNFIDSFCMVKSDGGGIYTWSGSGNTGRRIVGNIIINGIGDRYGLGTEPLTNPYAGDVQGIYLDGGATNIEITGNTVANCDFTGLHLGSSKNVLIENNTFYNNRASQVEGVNSNGPFANITMKHNILFAKLGDQLILELALSSNYLSTVGVIDSNYYCRPINEGQTNINTTGYQGTPYHGGGITAVYTPQENYRFRSFDVWKTYSSQDAHTQITYGPITDSSTVRFEYNATNQVVNIPLGGSYKDVKGDTISGILTLAPYSSKILLNPTGVIIEPPPVIIVPPPVLIPGIDSASRKTLIQIQYDLKKVLSDLDKLLINQPKSKVIHKQK